MICIDISYVASSHGQSRITLLHLLVPRAHDPSVAYSGDNNLGASTFGAEQKKIGASGNGSTNGPHMHNDHRSNVRDVKQHL